MSQKTVRLTFFDANEIVLELHFGEGGDDSKIFVDELFSTYLLYSRSLGLKAELIHSDFGHKIAKITGIGAAKAFENEPGKHCVQRIPPTETKGRKQTSMVVVGVLPIPPDNAIKELPMGELDITTTKGKVKAGGQNQNKVESAVRIVHKPTGVSVFICNERSQLANKQIALKIINAKVNEQRLQETNAEYGAIRKAQMGDSGRGAKRRTYNFMESRIVDHVLEKKTGNVKGFMKGNFSVLFDK